MNQREKLAVRFLLKYLLLTVMMALAVIGSHRLYVDTSIEWAICAAVAAIAYFVLVMIEVKRFIDAVEDVK